MSAATLIQELLDIYRVERLYRKKRDAARALQLSAELVSNYPQAIRLLAAQCIKESQDAFPGLDIVLSFLPMGDWPQLAAQAVAALLEKRENEPALTVIEKASLQFPRAIHPFLEQLFAMHEPRRVNVENQAFREARLEDVEFLFQYCQPEDPRSAYLCLLETRLPEALQYVKSHGGSFLSYLPNIGFEETDSGFRQLYPSVVYHISFPSGYAVPSAYLEPNFDYPSVLNHPTWVQPEADAPKYRFGGGAPITCGVCGEVAHHLITLEPVPPHLGITGVSPLQIVTCLSCLGWERPNLSYRHDSTGTTEDLNFNGSHNTPQFPQVPMIEIEIGLVDLGQRWRWQEWLGVGENLHRLGGHPSWVQTGEYPACPQCARTSSFLLQLDSDLPTTDGLELMWGSGGVCYIFWCDDCKVSTLLWQCS